MIIPQSTFTSQSKPLKVVGGGNFTAILLENGELYVAGECMLVSGEKAPGWHRIKGLFLDVACGWSHIIAVTSKHEVVAAGIGAKGELGLGSINKSHQFERVIAVQSPNAQVFACFYNSFVRDGRKLYGWGSNVKCQVFSPKSKTVNSPSLVYEGDISNVCVGKNSVCFIGDGIIHAQGAMNEYLPQMRSKLALSGNLELRSMWTSITAFDHKDFRFFGSAGQMQDAVTSCGQLHVHTVSCWSTGSEHGVMCCGNHVYCWGWGEHGNCGATSVANAASVASGINDQSNIKSGVNTVYVTPPQEKVVGCFGGCATTWICIERTGF
ncbi:LAQU0S01e14444g1_1 [Lachancea quebecensis]|uniref:LAQU0S01e14444g1_1 n=1 Tax=Lachancea quebecensis TaxID=1654605 RepID=A0A0P1KNK7_9SACH|nr:LAQU0S01e14444g1_1 [Lachancea quebecensis]